MRLSAVSRAVIVLSCGLLLGVAAFVVAQPSEPTAQAGPTSPPSNLPSSTLPSPTTSLAPSTTTTTILSSTTSSTEPPRGSLVIHGVGDVNTDTSYIPALAENGHAYAWEGLDGLFLGDDLTVINLECAPSDLGVAVDKTFIFRCDLDSLPVMAQAGIDVANLGNNHSGDYGKEALVDGLAQVETAGILPVGAGKDAVEASQPAIVEVNGWRVAVVGFGGVYPSLDWFATADTPGMADGDTIETMVETVQAASEVADLVVVTVHWGVELDTQPADADRAAAEAMIEAGADIIFGHHAHRLQPLEFIGDTPVAWNLGNFVWPNFSVAGSTTAVARVEVAPDGRMTACLLPAFITAPGRPELTGDPEC